jgi:HTH-type transcriptional regulator/antitoxin HigA
VNFTTSEVAFIPIKNQTMELSVIKSEKDYEDFLEWVDKQLDRKVNPDSPAGKKLEVALVLVKNYEDQHYPIPYPDPIEAIKLKMEELGLKNQDLVGKIGSKGYVSSVLNKRKPLTLEMARILHRELKIPAEILLS